MVVDADPEAVRAALLLGDAALDALKVVVADGDATVLGLRAED